MIPTRDGVHLAATLYLPDDHGGPWPIIVAATPYSRPGGHFRALAYAKAGFVFATVDVRGRGDSEGVFEPFVHDGADMYDAVEWLAVQPYSSGAVGLWGSSYGGQLQWTAAARRPPHLRSIEPAAAVLPGFDMPLRANISAPYFATWLAYTSGKLTHSALFSDLGYQASTYERVYRSGGAYVDIPQALGFPSATFKTWVEHPEWDGYWAALSPTAEEFAHIDLPILTITGYWDGAQLGALEYERRHTSHAPASAIARHFVVVGPFDHSGTRFPHEDVGGLKIPPGGVIDMLALDVAWFDWTLRGGPKPDFLRKRVAYYVVGADRWLYADSLAELGTQATSYWLSADGQRATNVYEAGALSTQRPQHDTTRSYRYDPADFSKAQLGTWSEGPWVIHQRDVLALDGDGLIYHSAPLQAPLTIAGRPKLEVTASISTVDTDLRARLYEVRADGTSVLLGYDRVRARYRESLEHGTLVKPGKVQRYTFEHFNFVAVQIPAGSRLRLVVDAPNSDHDQRNFNSGKPVALETLKDARVAIVTVHHGGAAASRLELPLLNLPASVK